MWRTRLLQKFNPDADSLLALLSKSVDNRMLREIAGEDYGDDVSLHFNALQQIRDTLTIPDPMLWHPREVLELHRWREFTKTLPRKTLEQAHTSRAFACAILLQVAGSGMGAEDQTIAVLLESLAFLDVSIQKEAIRFFAWHAQHLPPIEQERPFYPLALLILVLQTRTRLLPTELRDLINLIYDEVREARRCSPRSHKATPQWLKWLTNFKPRHKIWQALGVEIAMHADRFHNSEGRQNLKALARHLEEI